MDSLKSLHFSSFIIFSDDPWSLLVSFRQLFKLPLVVQCCDVICEWPLTSTFISSVQSSNNSVFSCDESTEFLPVLRGCEDGELRQAEDQEGDSAAAQVPGHEAQRGELELQTIHRFSV